MTAKGLIKMSRIMRTRFTVPDYSCHIWLRLCFGTLYQLVSTYSLYKILGRFVHFDFISSFFSADYWLFSRWHIIECWLGWGSSLPLDLSGPALQDAAVLQCCRSCRVQTAGTMTAANITPPRGNPCPDNAATSRNTVAYIEENSVTSFRLGK